MLTPNIQTGYPSIDKPWMKYFDDNKIHDGFCGIIYELIHDANKGRTENTCITYLGKKYTYGDMLGQVNDAAYSLLELGTKQGDIVSICLPGIPEAMVLILACSKIGAVANLIDPRINEIRIKECINGVNSSVVFFLDFFFDKFNAISKELVTDKIIAISPSESAAYRFKMLYSIKKVPMKDKFLLWKEFIHKAPCDIEPVSYQPQQIAAIVYSSGTTGVPKGIKLTNEGICHIASHSRDMMPDFVAGDVFLNIMPPFLAYGLVCGLIAPLYVGANIVLIPKFEMSDFIRLVRKYKPAVTMGVPNFYSVFVDNCNKKATYMKYSLIGGDKMYVSLESDINAAFKKMGTKYPAIKGYGMSELSSGVIVSVPTWLDKPGSCGIPLPGVNVKVLSQEHGEECKYNTVGELLINSPSAMLGYVDNNEEEEKIFYTDAEGVRWIRTGDLARIDEDGLIFIEGRIKRMIIRPDGHNVFPSVMEETILQNELVKAAGVVGASTKKYRNGQVPVAFIAMRENIVNREEALRLVEEYMLEKLPPRDVPMEYYLVDELPFTPNGKLDYVELQNKAEELLTGK